MNKHLIEVSGKILEVMTKSGEPPRETEVFSTLGLGSDTISYREVQAS